jgi:hypothetical protein
MKFREIDEATVKMYLQNMILYAKADKRYYLLSLLLNKLTINGEKIPLKLKENSAESKLLDPH